MLQTRTWNYLRVTSGALIESRGNLNNLHKRIRLNHHPPPRTLQPFARSLVEVMQIFVNFILYSGKSFYSQHLPSLTMNSSKKRDGRSERHLINLNSIIRFKTFFVLSTLLTLSTWRMWRQRRSRGLRYIAESHAQRANAERTTHRRRWARWTGFYS